MYLITLYFDELTNKRLRRYINRVAEKTGNDYMVSHKVPPHMTIAQIEARDVSVLVPYMEKLRGALSSGEIQFVSVGMLLPYVMYVAPVYNAYLNDLSYQIHDMFHGIEETTLSRFYQPGSWLPHVTIGKKLEKEQMQTGLCVMQEQFGMFSAKIVEIGLSKVNPHEDVVRFTLEN